MTELKKSFKGMAAALSMATLSLLGVGCNNDNRTGEQKKFDATVLQVMNYPNRLFSDEIDDKNKGERSANLNRLFEESEFIIETVQKQKKSFIRDAVKDALAMARKQGRLSWDTYDGEFLVNYTPDPKAGGNTDTDQWIRFFRNAAKESTAIRASGEDAKGVIPKTWTGKVFRQDVHGIWRETKSLSPYAQTTLAKQQMQLVQKRSAQGR